MSIVDESATVEDLIAAVSSFLKRHAVGGTTVFVSVDGEHPHGLEGQFTLISEEHLLELQLESLEKQQAELRKRLEEVCRLSYRKRQRRIGGLDLTIDYGLNLNKKKSLQPEAEEERVDIG